MSTPLVTVDQVTSSTFDPIRTLESRFHLGPKSGGTTRSFLINYAGVGFEGSLGSNS